MNAQRLTIYLLALAMVLPASMLVAMSTATAGPGSALHSASKSGKRTHKVANAKRKKNSKKKKTTRKKKRTKRTTTRRTTTTRSSAKTRRTTRSRSHTTRNRTRTDRRSTYDARRRTRTERKSPRTRRTRTTYNGRTRTESPRRTRTHRTRRTRTTYRHQNTRRNTRTQASTRSTSSTRRSSSKSSIEAYITGGLGYSGFQSSTISDEALPGAGYNVALGIKGDYIGFELGFNGSGHTFDPEAATTDLAVLGVSGDLKLQPSFSFFEPYALAGIGGYSLQDGVIDEASGGAALRLGLGADFRFDDAAIGVRYLHSTYGFADDTGIYGGDFGASSETLGVNLSFYF